MLPQPKGERGWPSPTTTPASVERGVGQMVANAIAHVAEDGERHDPRAAAACLDALAAELFDAACRAQKRATDLRMLAGKAA